MKHWAIFITNDSNKSRLVYKLLHQSVSEFSFLKNRNGALFSKITLERFIDKEDRHGTKIITQATEQALRTMSSGEQKKALLQHLFKAKFDFIILDSPFDNLDVESQKNLTQTLESKSNEITFIQIVSRKDDLLPFITNFARLNNGVISIHKTVESLISSEEKTVFKEDIPAAINPLKLDSDILIQLKDVMVRFGSKTVLQKINWTIKKGEFWQLVGKNGSGKTTLLSMITGENPKGYGQELFLFGKKKGSGESIWDIKRNIGYFTPSMTDKFTGYHTIENMLISGFNDSIGLYITPTEAQVRVAKQWLQLIELWEKKDTQFNDLSMGQKRLVMTTRAMIKHPLLLILDEPTASLDDASAKLLVALVNKIAKESDTATIFVSHRKEPGLHPDLVYELEMSAHGSTGQIHPKI